MKVIAGENHWDSGEELAARLAEGYAFAENMFPNDARWRNRIAQVAIGTSERSWKTFQTLDRRHVELVVGAMINSGFPGDEPVETSIRVLA